jgi:hypothetical protein
MGEWFFAEQQGIHRRAMLLREAERHRLLGAVPGVGLRERVAGALLAAALWLAPAEARGQIALAGNGRAEGERVLTGIGGS